MVLGSLCVVLGVGGARLSMLLPPHTQEKPKPPRKSPNPPRKSPNPLVQGWKCCPSPAAPPGAGAGIGECPSQRGSSAGGSALPGPVVSREMLTPLTRCQNTNTQPDSLKSNYEGAAEPGLALDSEESRKRHQGRNPAPAQCGLARSSLGIILAVS